MLPAAAGKTLHCGDTVIARLSASNASMLKLALCVLDLGPSSPLRRTVTELSAAPVTLMGIVTES
jgi:hypothetical protein